MAKPYGDDLRRKFFSAYDQGDISLDKLAAFFHVSAGWAKKISAARTRSGQCERPCYKPGRKAHAGPETHSRIRFWIGAQPDLTLVEIQTRLHREAAVTLSVPQVWHLLRKLGLRLKKSRSTPSNATAKPTRSGAKSLSKRSARSRRNA